MNGAREATFAILVAIMVPSVIAAGLLDHPVIVVGLIAVACGAHQAWSTIVFTVASDLFPSRAAGSVAGFGGFKAGMVSIVTAELVTQLAHQGRRSVTGCSSGPDSLSGTETRSAVSICVIQRQR